MNYVFFDLECDTVYSKRHGRFINEIIEVGAVCLSQDLEITGRFDMLVYPEIFKKLTSRITEMTGITTSDIEEQGKPFAVVMSAFERWIRGAGDCIVMSWSTSDLYMLLNNFDYFTDLKTIPFIYRYADFQKYIQDKLGGSGSRQISLADAAQTMGLDESGLRHHRAVDDSEICARMLIADFDTERLEKYVQDASVPAFYERLFFKPYIINDIRSPLIDRSQMKFDCPDCGVPAKQRSRFRYRNKAFGAEFECPECRGRFTGRVRFKKYYDRVGVMKFVVVPDRDKEEAEGGNSSGVLQPTAEGEIN